MKHKKLILTILMTLCMTIVAGFGVYATIASSLSISGTLNFVALTKEVYVNEIKISNYVDENYVSQTKIIDGWNGKYLKESASVSLGSGLNVVQGETLEIAITMTNLTSSYLRANLTYSDLGDMSVRTTGLIMPINSGKTVESGQAKTMKIYISSSSDEGYDLSQYSLNISFTSLGTSLLQDSGSYYYVEMGTVPNTSGTGAEYIKWRLVSQDMSTEYGYSTTKPTGLGYFIVQNDLSTLTVPSGNLAVAFQNDCTGSGYDVSNPYLHNSYGWTDINALDYATSTVRQYINGEKVYKQTTSASPVYTPTGDYSDFLTDINIDRDNDLVYNSIVGRTLNDLYSNINDDGSALEFPTFSSSAKKIISSNESDKLWLPSLTEADALLVNLTWRNGSNNGFWLRTPGSSRPDQIYIYYRWRSSDTTNQNTTAFLIRSYYARPMFKLSI